MEIDTYSARGVISFGLLIVLPLEMAYKDLCSPSGARFLRLVRPPVLCLGFISAYVYNLTIVLWIDSLCFTMSEL